MTELGEKDTDLGEKNTNLMVASHASQHAMGGTVAGSHALHKDIAIIRFDMAFVFCAWHYIWIVVGCHFVKLTVAILVQLDVSDNKQF